MVRDTPFGAFRFDMGPSSGQRRDAVEVRPNNERPEKMRGVIGRRTQSGRSVTRRAGSWLKRSVLISLAIVLPLGVSVAGPAGSASAAFNPDGFDFWVDSSMGPI